MRSLSVIATEIEKTWPKPYFGARPYIQALKSVDGIDDRYGAEDAETLVRHFLVNADTWRGPDARRIKAELKGML